MHAAGEKRWLRVRSASSLLSVRPVNVTRRRLTVCLGGTEPAWLVRCPLDLEIEMEGTAR